MRPKPQGAIAIGRRWNLAVEQARLERGDVFGGGGWSW